MDIINRFILQASSLGVDKVARDAERLTRAASNSAKATVDQFKKIGAAAAAAAAQMRNAFGGNRALPSAGTAGGGAPGGLPPRSPDGRFLPGFGRGPGNSGGGGSGGGGFSNFFGGGGFGQGFLQGALPQSFIQRGPGMLAQGAGILAGRGVRGAAGALGSAAMGDLSGMIGALGGAIPGVGAPLAALASNAVGQSGRALQYYGGIGSSASGLGGLGSSFAGNMAGLSNPRDIARLQALGISRQSALGIAGQGLAASGGTLADLNRISPNALSQLGVASQMGVSPGSAATIMRGSQIGVQTTRPDKQFADAVSAGVRTGLRGSDLTHYLESMAQNIQSFRQTGMPIASAQNYGRMTAGIVNSGISPIRAQAIAQNAQQSLAGIGENGPQDATQIALLRMAAGGRLETPEDEVRGRLNLESGDYVSKHFAEMREQVANMVGGGPEGILRLHAFDQQYGGRSLTETARPGAYRAGRAQFSGDDLQALAAQQVSSESGTAAGIEDTNLGTGQKMLGVVQQSEQRMADLLSRSSGDIAAVLQKVTDAAGAIPDEFNKVALGASFLADSFKVTYETLKGMMGGSDGSDAIVNAWNARRRPAGASQQ